jgi:dTDP-4-dehydrorhamnose reductase
MVLNELKKDAALDVYGTTRSSRNKLCSGFESNHKIMYGIDVLQNNSLCDVFEMVKPNVVVNCAGLIKQNVLSCNPLKAIPINSVLPHQLAQLCNICGSRLIHISTDCVFSGAKGDYRECDQPDARDLYGLSKLLGEVDYPNAVTLRTSIIGHEVGTKNGLLSWFLDQDSSCNGYTKAIFSGLPTVILAEIIRKVVIPLPQLNGLYHVGADPISKFELLKMIAVVYEKKITIKPDESVSINRSLNCERFKTITGYKAPNWESMIKAMYKSR